MAKKTPPKRKFIRERRRNACPACLDREERYEGLPGRKNFQWSEKFNKCEMCGTSRNGTVVEVFLVGSEWRRYPWDIVA